MICDLKMEKCLLNYSTCIFAGTPFILLSLFYNVWLNPQTKLFEIAQYIMMMAGDRSTTWSFHLRLICRKYGLPDPIQLMQQAVMPKPDWKVLVQTRVTVLHEAELRRKAASNYKLQYFNVQLLGLTGDHILQ